MKTIEASRVDRAELAQLDSIAKELPADSQLGTVLHALSRAVKEGTDVLLTDASESFSPAVAARFLQVSRTHLYKVMDAGGLPYVEVGRDRRIYGADLLAFDEKRRSAGKDLAERFGNPARGRVAALQELTKVG